MITINDPNGQPVQFPDGTDDATIKAVMAKNFPNAGGGGPSSPGPVASPNNAAPVTKPAPPPAAPPPAAPPTPTPSFGLGFDQGFVQPLLNAGVGIEDLLGAVGIPSINKAIGGHSANEIRAAHEKWLADQQIPNAPDNDAPGQSRSPSLAGQIVGAAPAAAVTGLVTKNPYAVGAMMGLGQTQADNPQDAAIDVGASTVLGKAGEAGVKTLGAVTAPVWRPAVNRLLQAGVRLTPGQIIGGAAKHIEEASQSLPITGDIIGGASRQAAGDAQIASVNQALAPLGLKVPKGTAPGHDAIAYAQQAFADGYAKVYSQSSLHFDNQLATDLQNEINNARQSLPPQYAKQVSDLVDKEIRAPFNQGTTGGQPYLHGDAIKDVDRQLGQEAATFRKGGPYDQKYANVVEALQDHVQNALARQNPAAADALANLDQGYAKLTVAERAAAAGKGGVPTPAQQVQASRTADTSVRKRATAAGRGPSQQFATDTQEVMQRDIPDSGTPYRHMVQAATGAGAFLGTELGNLNPLMIAGYLAPGLPYLRGVSSLVRGAMTRRPSIAPVIRKGITATAPVARAAGAQYGVNKRNARMLPVQEE